ncbi:protein FAM13A [Betta splendens]|uniref:Protein FAM13A n=1 Tax=Betta splendens TaxID=158456 RepID=A0A9W2XPU3_BETSP|nr:protein FAM13A [Betta splendens]
MGAGALTICHNKTAVQVKEDMKKMVQMPILRPRAVAAKHTKLFGVSLFELRDQGLVQDGVPLVVRRMVEHLRSHALRQEGLFRVNGNVRAVQSLKLRLEGGEDVDLLSECDTCTVASLLKQYLRDLPEGLVSSTVQQQLIRHHQESDSAHDDDDDDDDPWSDMRHLLQQLPDVHHSLLRYLCHFLTLVECNREDNRMTALNLATVFGPSVFHVTPGVEAMKDQNICNSIMVKLIQNYEDIFEPDLDQERCTEELSTLIIVKETRVTDEDTNKSPAHLHPSTRTAAPRIRVGQKNPAEDSEHPDKASINTTRARTRTKKVRRDQGDGAPHLVSPPISAGSPRTRPLSAPTASPCAAGRRSPSPEAMEAMETAPAPHGDLLDASPCGSAEALSRSHEEERPISPFYMSSHLSPVHCRPDVLTFLDRTVRSTVEQHLFDGNPIEDQRSGDCGSVPCLPSPRATVTARQRRRHQREQQEQGHQDRKRAVTIRTSTDKENIPSHRGSGRGGGAEARGGRGGLTEHSPKPRKAKQSPAPVLLADRQDAHTQVCSRGWPSSLSAPLLSLMVVQTLRMKIQESPVACDAGRVGGGGGGDVRGSEPDCEKTSCEDVPRLDLTALTEDSSWGDPPFFSSPYFDFKSVFHPSCCDEPVPAYSHQRESMDREEARLSPHAGGRLIRQLLEEDSDPMVSPRFYAYGQCQQYVDDTEVPPSPPNAHSFVSRRRSSSLGSCDDEKEELTSAQLTKRIHVLKKKIHRYEEKFEEERKYRPSHSDKVANPEVLRWVNELARLRKELKEHKLLKSEEDLPPLTRQRSNTLPKSFGSQLEKKPQQEKVPKPPVESTLDTISKKLQEKREEVNRPEDIKDMTREQIGAEKVALQKALLYYENIHGRPVTKSERQVMKPLYDRYRLVKQILCRASTIPVIGSPSSKRRGPLLQPIIEGETALFFDDIKEEEDGSEDDGESKTQFTVTDRPDLSVLSFLDHMDEEVDGFISPVDELSPSKNTMDMGLSNLHSATMQELVEQLQETREEKKRIRKNLKEFEDQFFRQNGRNVQKEDRSPLAVEYNEYKHVKAKLRLLEVLISKRDSTKFI